VHDDLDVSSGGILFIKKSRRNVSKQEYWLPLHRYDYPESLKETSLDSMMGYIGDYYS
jgi:hypothetical protein